MQLKMVSVKLSFLAKKRSVTKRGLSWKKLTMIKLPLKVLSTVKLKAVSLLKLTQCALSFLVHWLMYVQYVTQLTLKAKSLNSKLSSLMQNATTLLFLVVQLSKQKAAKSAKHFLQTLKKATKSKVSLRTLPITVRSLTLVA